jgi:hypothetical protein
VTRCKLGVKAKTTHLLTRVLTLKTGGKASLITDLYCLFKSLPAREHLVFPTITPSGFNIGTIYGPQKIVLKY